MEIETTTQFDYKNGYGKSKFEFKATAQNEVMNLCEIKINEPTPALLFLLANNLQEIATKIESTLKGRKK